MRVNELMIGDWVQTKEVHTPDYYQPSNKRIVSQIKSCGAAELCFYDRYGNKCYENKCYNHIEPIPLTAEILEKNGFVNGILRVFATPFLRQRVWSKVEVYEYKPFRNGKQLNAYRLMIGGKETSGVDIHINYVHELQHALKLCGIDKDIEL